MTDEERAGDVTLLTLFAIIWKRRRLVLGTTFVVAIASGLFLLVSVLLPPDKSFLPNLYKSSAIVLVRAADGSNGLGSALSSTGLGILSDLAGMGKGGQPNGYLIAALATDDQTLDALAERFSLAEHYRMKNVSRSVLRTATAKHLSVKFDDRTSRLTIACEDRNPELARDVVDTLISIAQTRIEVLVEAQEKAQLALLDAKYVEANQKLDVLSSQANFFAEKWRKIGKTKIIAGLFDQQSGVGTAVFYPDFGGSEEAILKYYQLKREIASSSEVHAMLTRQRELVSLLATGNEPVFQKLQDAQLPDSKYSPSRGKIGLAIVGSAFFIALLMAFVLEYSVPKNSNRKAG